MTLGTFRFHILSAASTLALTLTVVLGGDPTPEWAALRKTQDHYHRTSQSFRDQLTDLKTHKTELLDQVSNPSANREPAAQKSADALAATNIEIEAVEARLQKLLKKTDYLLSIKLELTDAESLERASKAIKVQITSTERDLKQVNQRMDQISKSCKECRITTFIPEREIASKNKLQREFHELSQERAQLEDRLDNYHLREEALRDLSAIAEDKVPADRSKELVGHGADSRR